MKVSILSECPWLTRNLCPIRISALYQLYVWLKLTFDTASLSFDGHNHYLSEKA
jgi:hypothetical protein